MAKVQNLQTIYQQFHSNSKAKTKLKCSSENNSQIIDFVVVPMPLVQKPKQFVHKYVSYQMECDIVLLIP